MHKTTISNDDKEKDKEEPRNDQETSSSCNTDVSIDEGDFVAVVYRLNSNTYVGKVICYDDDDAFVSFMAPSTRKIEVSTSFQWPTKGDKISSIEGGGTSAFFSNFSLWGYRHIFLKILAYGDAGTFFSNFWELYAGKFLETICWEIFWKLYAGNRNYMLVTSRWKPYAGKLGWMLAVF